MIYEKRINSIPELRKQLATLDGDAGVRVVGSYEGAECFAFVTRFHDKYTMLVYGAKGTSVKVPGRLLASKECHGTAGLLESLQTIAGRSLEAYAY